VAEHHRRGVGHARAGEGYRDGAGRDHGVPPAEGPRNASTPARDLHARIVDAVRPSGLTHPRLPVVAEIPAGILRLASEHVVAHLLLRRLPDGRDRKSFAV
jgi:hypothetical protein